MKLTKLMVWISVTLTLATILMPTTAPAQGRGNRPDPQMVAAREKDEKELESIAIIDRKVMVPMRDGKRMAADIYRPKDTSKKVPIIFVRTPYNFNFWDVRNGTWASMKEQLEAVKRGYAYVEMNERGHFFSEGNYDILGPPLTDGTDAITWMSSQSWSNGKVGTFGGSYMAHVQNAMAVLRPPHLSAMFIMVGAGDYFEEGAWRGGAFMLLHNVFYAGSAYVSGWISDIVPHRKAILAGGYALAGVTASLRAAFDPLRLFNPGRL